MQVPGPPGTKSRPILAALHLCLGGALLLGGTCFAVFEFGDTDPNHPITTPNRVHRFLREQAALAADAPGYQAYFLVTRLAPAVFGLALLVCGVGLLRMKKWARTLSIGLSIAGFLYLLLVGAYHAVYIRPVMLKLS
jgi:hypothetical protein